MALYTNVTDNFVVVKSPDGFYTKVFEDSLVRDDIADKVFEYAAHAICFSDCCDDDIEAIYVNGRRVKYVGWQPGMLYEFYDAETGEVVWSRKFPHWDH